MMPVLSGIFWKSRPIFDRLFLKYYWQLGNMCIAFEQALHEVLVLILHFKEDEISLNLHQTKAVVTRIYDSVSA